MLPPVNSRLRSDGFGSARIPPSVLILEVKRKRQDQNEELLEWVLVERREEVERDGKTGKVHRAKVCIYYWDLSGQGDANDVPSGDFLGSYDARWNTVSLTAGALDTGGYVLIEPCRLRSARLGTYLMNTIVAWAKQWPDAQVREVKLLSSDANGENRVRRNRFYRQFGIEFDFIDDDESAGVSRPMLAQALTTTTSWEESITEHNLVTHARQTASAVKALKADLRFVRQDLKKTSRELGQAYQYPFRWLFQRVVNDNWPRTISATVIITVLGFAALKLT
ncbi:hypothetical protein KY495_20500 [Massilia sp. PAMC28688]|uniref:hypothetical protein n=1 Tax=Massilia sp. PAMC28688 TaxID=2861283 RepID=UPI001C63A760|nr:hypothetical protein [Massilia sp. PAMC28688]QYF93053.1 hypothetical protein KY495_20500 [Massilia sp. PAMC28688]